MSKVLVENSSLTGIGGAIREKLNVSTTYKPSQMPAAIRSIQSGITPTGTKSITENGTYDVTNYASASVNIPQPSGTKQITENGTYDVTDYASAVVNVSGGGGGISILSGISIPSDNIGINGQIYLQYGNEEFSSFSVYKESSMNITPNQNNIVFDYLGASAIGGQAYKQFDLTDIDEISFSITSGHHSYNNYQTERFAPLVIIENTVNPANNFVGNTLPYIPGSRISTDDTTINLTVDVSSYTGNYWIVFCSYGCDSVVNLLGVGESQDGPISQTYCKVNGVWQNLVGTDISNVNLGA